MVPSPNAVVTIHWNYKISTKGLYIFAYKINFETIFICQKCFRPLLIVEFLNTPHCGGNHLTTRGIVLFLFFKQVHDFHTCFVRYKIVKLKCRKHSMETRKHCYIWYSRYITSLWLMWELKVNPWSVPNNFGFLFS